MRALDGNVGRAKDIAEVLRIMPEVIKGIMETTYRNHPALQPIAFMVAWLRGQHGKSGFQAPYTFLPESERHASWWSLVFAVDIRTGGNNRPLAEKIAKNHRG